MNSYLEMNEVIASDAGKFDFGEDGYGELFSTSGDTYVEGQLKGDSRFSQ